jgi:hypothetical protein
VELNEQEGDDMGLKDGDGGVDGVVVRVGRKKERKN